MRLAACCLKPTATAATRAIATVACCCYCWLPATATQRAHKPYYCNYWAHVLLQLDPSRGDMRLTACCPQNAATAATVNTATAGCLILRSMITGLRGPEAQRFYLSSSRAVLLLLLLKVYLCSSGRRRMLRGRPCWPCRRLLYQKHARQ